LRKRAIVSPITASVHGIATHPEDDMILATAVSGHADYLVTGDSKLERLGKYKSVTILSPRRFLETLVQETAKE
jgi:predicted nucleic acid-binding protein